LAEINEILPELSTQGEHNLKHVQIVLHRSLNKILHDAIIFTILSNYYLRGKKIDLRQMGLSR